jgi:retron-type reverse transcriptase
MDLEKFFDTVNQSKLIEVLSRTVKDGRVISLIHKYLNAGVVVRNKFEETEMGVPQGSPLSPVLSNIMLNELDKELERRGHRFVRYADDSVPRTRTGVILFSGAAHKMRDGPSELVFRHRLQTTLCGIN